MATTIFHRQRCSNHTPVSAALDACFREHDEEARGAKR
jgi:hypothetical protein